MRYKVLLIDDEPSALEGMQLWIDWEAFGFEVCGTCSNGKEGLELMHERHPDLVITDVNMPLMNGLEMIAAWKQEENQNEVKFAILSGYSEFEYAQTAIRYGIHHYLLKPIFPEEAAEELQEIYHELEQHTRRERLDEIASSEEMVSLIKGLMNGKLADEGSKGLLERLSEGQNTWNVCLVQTVPELYAKRRSRLAALLAEKSAMYLIDMETGSLAIVYGTCKVSRTEELREMLGSLQQEGAEDQLYAAIGTSEASLFQIERSCHTAKEALQHYFYLAENPGIVSYEEIKGTLLYSKYDHLRHMDAIMGAVNTLDISGFRQAVDTVAASFREQRVAPDAVKKFVLHILYRILELSPIDSRGQDSFSLETAISEIQDSMSTLPRVVNHLSSCGETVIALLLKEQDQQSYGIVREINRYIEQHYRERLTIQKLAEVFYLHPVYLGQLLIKKNGISFNEQLHSLRIQEAALLLRENKWKLCEIAERVGYANYNQFLKQFEKKMQVCPNEYRSGKF